MSNSSNRKTPNQLYDELCKITFTKKDGVHMMEKIMFDAFKKRKIHLLDANQLSELLDKLKSHYKIH